MQLLVAFLLLVLATLGVALLFIFVKERSLAKCLFMVLWLVRADWM